LLRIAPSGWLISCAIEPVSSPAILDEQPEDQPGLEHDHRGA
jgi:hypothetical protein